MEIGSRRSFLMPLCLHQVKFIIQSETSVNLFACVSERRTGASLKILNSSASQASNRKPRGCGGRDFISFISAISEGQSTPCHAWTGFTPLASSVPAFSKRKSVQDSHYGFVQPVQAWIPFYTARERQEPAERSHDQPVSASI
jgi:hypothetical protein